MNVATRIRAIAFIVLARCLECHILDPSIVTSQLSSFYRAERCQRPGRAEHVQDGRPVDRRHSFPFITGDGFRMLADYAIDDAASAHDAYVRLSSPVHKGDRAPAVLYIVNDPAVYATVKSLDVVKQSKKPLVIVVHNGDPDSIADDELLDNDNVVAVFSQNCARSHPKLVCIPIGLENRRWPMHGSAPETLIGAMTASLRGPFAADALRSDRHVAIACFSSKTYPRERQPLLNAIDAQASTWITRNCSTDALGFYRSMLHHSAVIAPRGNGLDTHRAWEALYMGRIVITLSSRLDPLWEGLPVVVLRSWDELIDKRRTLSAIRAAIHDRDYNSATPKLFLQHWACAIGRAARRGDEFCSVSALLRLLGRP